MRLRTHWFFTLHVFSCCTVPFLCCAPAPFIAFVLPTFRLIRFLVCCAFSSFSFLFGTCHVLTHFLCSNLLFRFAFLDQSLSLLSMSNPFSVLHSSAHDSSDHSSADEEIIVHSTHRNKRAHIERGENTHMSQQPVVSRSKKKKLQQRAKKAVIPTPSAVINKQQHASQAKASANGRSAAAPLVTSVFPSSSPPPPPPPSSTAGKSTDVRDSDKEEDNSDSENEVFEDEGDTVEEEKRNDENKFSDAFVQMISPTDLQAAERLFTTLSSHPSSFFTPMFRPLRLIMHPLIEEQLRRYELTNKKTLKKRRRELMSGRERELEMDRQTRNTTILRAKRLKKLEELQLQG